LREQLVQDEAVLLMAQAPLQVLNNVLRVWEQTPGRAADAAGAARELEEAAGHLGSEIERLSLLLRPAAGAPQKGLDTRGSVDSPRLSEHHELRQE
jgi:hypothetical protein